VRVAKDDEFEIDEVEDDDELDEDLDDEDLEGIDLDEVDDIDSDEADEGGEDEEDEDEEESLPEEEDEEELEEESLDVLLARDQGLDESELGRDEPRDGLGLTTIPPGAGEFTCRSCFLVKRQAQLADEKKMICFDCA
jgi:hypothetical protein